MQKAVYKFAESNGKVSKEDVMKSFNLTEPELQVQLAALRHCELVKGHKEGDRVYLVPFRSVVESLREGSDD